MAHMNADSVESEVRKRTQAEDIARPNMEEYIAYGHFRSKNMPCLQLYFNATERKAHGKKKQQLQYTYIEPDDADSGLAEDRQSFSVVFTTSESRMRLTVTGRNLENIYDLISYGKLAYIRSIDNDRDFRGIYSDKAEVITSIALKPE